MTSVGDVRAVVLEVADEVPLAQAVAALDELDHRAQALQARLHGTGDQESTWPYDSSVRLLIACAR